MSSGHDTATRLAHHFDSPEQQFESGKQGMWLFLGTEILLFGGLFCAYAVYRGNHPEIFAAGSRYLDRTLGAVNTVVLICSSLTMAWGVHCAQRGQPRGLILCLALTLLCACGFLGIKCVEYEHKWKHGLLWGARFDPIEHEAHPATMPAAAAEKGQGTASAPAIDAAGQRLPPRSQLAPPGPELGGLATPAGADAGHAPHADHVRNVHLFFSIYFAMTGLHGVHVIAGMIAIGWILMRSRRGEFGSNYFLPVDLVGLYWHVVDMIWIFLFPLLYLIH